MKKTISMFADLSDSQLDSLSLGAIQQYWCMLEVKPLVINQPLIGRHVRRAVGVIVAPINGPAHITVQLGSITAKRDQESEGLGPALKVNVINFGHDTWKPILPSLTVGLLTRLIVSRTLRTHVRKQNHVAN